MSLRWLLAAVHLLGLGAGLGAVWTRARALQGELDPARLRQVFYADSWWGVAAVIWIASGLWRLLGGLEKGTEYYLHNYLFWIKNGLSGTDSDPRDRANDWPHSLASHGGSR